MNTQSWTRYVTGFTNWKYKARSVAMIAFSTHLIAIR